MDDTDQGDPPVLGTGRYASEAIDEMGRRLGQLRAENETLRAEVDRLRKSRVAPPCCRITDEMILAVFGRERVEQWAQEATKDR